MSKNQKPRKVENPEKFKKQKLKILMSKNQKPKKVESLQTHKSKGSMKITFSGSCAVQAPLSLWIEEQFLGLRSREIYQKKKKKKTKTRVVLLQSTKLMPLRFADLTILSFLFSGAMILTFPVQPYSLHSRMRALSSFLVDTVTILLPIMSQEALLSSVLVSLISVLCKASPTL